MRGRRIFILAGLLLVLSIFINCSVSPCLQLLDNLEDMRRSNHSQFVEAMAPYAVLSGKILDDMGFPRTCIKNPNFAYTQVVVELTQIDENQKYPLTMYYGLCFSNLCSTETLNQQGQFLVQHLWQNQSLVIQSLEFQEISMEVQFYPGALVISLLIAAFIIFRMVPSIQKWGNQCMISQQNQIVEVQLQEQGIQPQVTDMQLSFWDKISLQRSSRVFQDEGSVKIAEFSWFKLIATPLLVYGYNFYLSNYGAYNYFSIDNQIYSKFYAKLAIATYYLPDVFFFISGYLFASKLFRIDEVDEQKDKQFFKALGKKLLKLYPLYIAIIFIYWFVSPAMHAGPLWNPYLQQVNQCNSTCWRMFILIDNWFNNGCYNYAWYVQVQIQFALLLVLIFVIYARKRILAIVILYVFTITALVLLFQLSQPLPSSIETTISLQAQLYFQAFYSHLFFYLFGVLLALYFQKQSVRSFIQTNFVQNLPIFTGVHIFAFAVVILIVSQPGVWDRALQLELGLSRLGFVLSFLIFFLRGMTSSASKTTYLHKLSILTYPIILVAGLVSQSGFWGLETFNYLDSYNLLSTTIPNLMISIVLGGFLGFVFDFSKFRICK